MIVVLDTNIWIKELALKSNVGSALRFFLRHRSARLAIPEVVRLEVQRHLTVDILKAIEIVRKGHGELVALFGSVKEVLLPKDAEVKALVDTVFDRLEVETLELPFSLESARASFEKTIAKAAPSDRSQEFKDGVIWADCMKLLQEEDVVFATQDKAFFQDRKYERGLESSMLEEARACPHRLTLVSSLAEVLDQVRTELKFDDQWLLAAIRERSRATVEELLSRNGSVIAGDAILVRELFATEVANRLYFTYTVDVPCSDASEMGRRDIKLSLSGRGILDAEVPAIVDLWPSAESLTFVESDGTEGRKGTQYVYAGGISVGHATVHHEVRYGLGNADQPTDPTDGASRPQ